MKCNNCGICCKDGVSLCEYDYKRIKREIPNLDKFITTKMFGTYTLQKPCPFLSNNRCTIYNIRPYICRAYPIVPAITQKDSILAISNKLVFTLIEQCPCRNTLTKTDKKRAKIFIKKVFEYQHQQFDNMTKDEIVRLLETASTKVRRKTVTRDELI